MRTKTARRPSFCCRWICVLGFAGLLACGTGCATSPDQDGLSGPSLEPPNENLLGSGHRRIETDTNEINIELGRYKKSF